MKIILASGSPRRKELLEMMNLKFEVITSNADETFENGLTIEEQSKRLAYIKAKAVYDITLGDRIIIGSDSMVLKDDKIFRKPKSKQDAINMLSELNNSYHTVITSLCVLIEKDKKYKEYITYDTTKVHFKNMTQEEIKAWVDTERCMDKAGGYAVQDEFGVYIDEIQGSFFTVMGLPIHKLDDVLKKEILNKK